jgi:hypothetical protein
MISSPQEDDCIKPSEEPPVLVHFASGRKQGYVSKQSTYGTKVVTSRRFTKQLFDPWTNLKIDVKYVLNEVVNCQSFMYIFRSSIVAPGTVAEVPALPLFAVGVLRANCSAYPSDKITEYLNPFLFFHLICAVSSCDNIFSGSK